MVTLFPFLSTRRILFMRLDIGLAFLTHSMAGTPQQLPRVAVFLQVTVLQTLLLKQSHISIATTRLVILALTILESTL
jgi:hypothetical protein